MMFHALGVAMRDASGYTKRDKKLHNNLMPAS